MLSLGLYWQADRDLIFLRSVTSHHGILNLEVSTEQYNKALPKWIGN